LPSHVVLVDESDTPLGLAETVAAHTGAGALHRAYTVLVRDPAGRFLLQRRSAEKMLWPLAWEATCSSHPAEGENHVDSARARLLEELGFTCDLRYLDTFVYEARDRDVGVEREVCALLVGEYEGPVEARTDEVAEWRWETWENAQALCGVLPEVCAPWLPLALEVLRQHGEA
jgi:isopentenyl-diphosphate Delta-isomerase